MPKEYIEREATLEVLRNLGSRDYRREKGTIADAMKMIMHSAYIPAADVVEVRHGKWEKFDHTCEVEYICSNCNFSIIEADPKQKCEFIYCPMCGGKNE